MRIVDLKYRNEEPLVDECGLCLGNFDGVHRGHRALIRELVDMNRKREARLPLGALLFREPPSLLLSPRPVPQLTTLEEKMDLLSEAGLRFAILYDFEDLMHLSPSDFVQRILIGECRCRMAVCGFNYSYGAGGAGNPYTLSRDFGARQGCSLSVVAPVSEGPDPISSSAIRSLLLQGSPDRAAHLLGRPYSLSGKVTEGKSVGHTMGFPTANLTFPEGRLVPAHGVYLCMVHVEKERADYYGICNVGIRPTFDDGEHVNCETFILNFDGDLYGKDIRVSFLRFLREERRFASAEELRRQIDRDVSLAMEYIGI